MPFKPDPTLPPAIIYSDSQDELKESNKLSPILKVPTKPPSVDGTSSSLTGSPTKENKFDAFWYYSNDDLRMEALLMKNSQDTRRPLKRQKVNIQDQEKAWKRKTKISFELDPMKIMNHD